MLSRFNTFFLFINLTNTLGDDHDSPEI